jgi:hypothetical protein
MKPVNLHSLTRIVVVNDVSPDQWEVIGWNGVDVAHLGTRGNQFDGLMLAQDIRNTYGRRIKIDLEDTADFNGYGDNTCRVRVCRWCAADACSLIDRNDRLPAPQINLTQETWTVENSVMARECVNFQMIDY